MTAFDFWKTIVLLVIIKGNAYVHIKRNHTTGEIENLILLDSDSIDVVQKNETLFYYTK